MMSVKIVVNEKEMDIEEARDLWTELNKIFEVGKGCDPYVPPWNQKGPWYNDQWTVYGEIPLKEE
jgi:hypothetical protein